MEYVRGSRHSAEQGQFQFDALKTLLTLAHVAIVAYVTLGWMQDSRIGLFIYVLALPLIVMQWLCNSGSSVISNLETLVRQGHWRDPRNRNEGCFFQSLLYRWGLPASTAQINTAICFIMLMFWIAAMFHMVLIVPPRPGEIEVSLPLTSA